MTPFLHLHPGVIGKVARTPVFPTITVSTAILEHRQLNSIIDSIGDTSENFRFSAAVAGFAQVLKGGKYLANASGAKGYAENPELHFDDVLRLAQQAKGADNFGYRSEFLNIVRLAKALSPKQSRQELSKQESQFKMDHRRAPEKLMATANKPLSLQ